MGTTQSASAAASELSKRDRAASRASAVPEFLSDVKMRYPYNQEARNFHFRKKDTTTGLE